MNIKMVSDNIKCISKKVIDEVISLRRTLHKYPEPGFKEFQTSSLISATLDRLGLEVKTNMAKTGVCAVLSNERDGKTVAVRSDMDALPITECTSLPYASVNSGTMHACGHDVHMAIVLGAAMILSRMKEELNGSVKCIFQPAEEGLGGARYMIEDGALKNPDVDAIIAAHIKPSLDTGKIIIGEGPVMASPGEFRITITGKGGHAAEPHKSTDPVVIAANLVGMLQTIITRETNPVKNALISVTCINAGNTYNIIPDTAQIKGTVRTFDKDVEMHIKKRMEEMSVKLSEAYGASCRFEYDEGYPPVVNNKRIASLVAQAAEKITGKENVITDADPSMLAEDFSYYAGKVPGAMFFLGCTNSEKGPQNLHSSRLDIDEKCIRIGMEVLAQFCVDFLEN
ncbi:MAG TPA: M20 family metallopeptidase [Clostridia bacterium]